MTGRFLAMVFMLLAAVLSFALAIYSAIQGRIPIFETAHALVFVVFALLLASTKREAAGDACPECGTVGDWGLGFCAGCGRIPKVPHAGAA